MREHITHVAFDMHQASITAAWLLPSASNPELCTVPHEPKPFRRLVKEILAHGPARACYEWNRNGIGSWKNTGQRAGEEHPPGTGAGSLPEGLCGK